MHVSISLIKVTLDPVLVKMFLDSLPDVRASTTRWVVDNRNWLVRELGSTHFDRPGGFSDVLGELLPVCRCFCLVLGAVIGGRRHVALMVGPGQIREVIACPVVRALGWREGQEGRRVLEAVEFPALTEHVPWHISELFVEFKIASLISFQVHELIEVHLIETARVTAVRLHHSVQVKESNQIARESKII